MGKMHTIYVLGHGEFAEMNGAAPRAAFAIGSLPITMPEFRLKGVSVFEMPSQTDAYRRSVARQALRIAMWGLAVDCVLGSTRNPETLSTTWIAKATDYCRPAVPAALLMEEQQTLIHEFATCQETLRLLSSNAAIYAHAKAQQADLALSVGPAAGEEMSLEQRYRDAMTSHASIIAGWAKSLTGNVALIHPDTCAGEIQRSVLAAYLKDLGLQVVVGSAKQDDDDAGEDSTPAIPSQKAQDLAQADSCGWRLLLPVSSPVTSSVDPKFNLDGVTVSQHPEGACRTVFGDAQAVAEESPLFLDVEEIGLEPGLLMLELPEAEPIAAAGESQEAFQVRWDAWKERDMARAKRLNLDALQERLNAPARRLTSRHLNAKRQDAAKVLVTRALRTSDQPHPELVLAGQLLPDNMVEGAESAESIADWITQIASTPELLTEFTADPDAPAHLAGIGLTAESALPTQDLAKLRNDIIFSLSREAGRAMWSGDAVRLQAAIDKVAAERGLDPVALAAFVQDDVAKAMKQHDLLFTGIIAAFVSGRSEGIQWVTKLQLDGRREWIRTYVRSVAAVLVDTQRTPHWHARALQFGGFTSPAEFKQALSGLTRYEREFIRVRVSTCFAVGGHRTTMPLGTLATLVRTHASTSRVASTSHTTSPVAA